jgi:hypothetical protein
MLRDSKKLPEALCGTQRISMVGYFNQFEREFFRYHTLEVEERIFSRVLPPSTTSKVPGVKPVYHLPVRVGLPERLL